MQADVTSRELDPYGVGRRPALLGSPMRTPMCSPPTGPCGQSWDVPALSLDDDDAAAIQAAIEASLGDDMKRRLQSSLQSTQQELQNEYPEISTEEGVPNIKRARLRSSSDLEEAVTARGSPVLEPADIAQPPPFSPEAPAPLTAPSPLDFEGLLDHEMLLESIYAAQGFDLRARQSQAEQVLSDIGLKALDLGVKNFDEEGRELLNQCFYLSIARSYLGPLSGAEEVQKAALLLKRTVEACVLSAHPEWASDDSRLGENAMAFADFLPSAMGAKDPPNLCSRLAVVIIDSTQCMAEVYLGPLYSCAHEGCERTREELEKNLVLLCYTPGHYKALVLDDDMGAKPAWTYAELKSLLEQQGVLCIETSDFD